MKNFNLIIKYVLQLEMTKVKLNKKKVQTIEQNLHENSKTQIEIYVTFGKTL